MNARAEFWPAAGDLAGWCRAIDLWCSYVDGGAHGPDRVLQAMRDRGAILRRTRRQDEADLVELEFGGIRARLTADMTATILRRWQQIARQVLQQREGEGGA